MSGDHILVVDDEPRYLKLISYNLKAAGYHATCVGSGEQALTAVAAASPDLIILDIRLPGMDGFEVCRRLREYSSVPIIMLTALGQDEDKVRGLREGADDYVTKPFSAQELLARVEAVLRRSRLAEVPSRETVFASGELRIEFAARRVTKGGEELKLTPTEYRLLQCLAANAGRVVTGQELLEKVWGPEYREQYEGLRMYISRLRQKIEDSNQEPRYLLTYPGIGYMLAQL